MRDGDMCVCVCVCVCACVWCLGRRGMVVSASEQTRRLCVQTIGAARESARACVQQRRACTHASCATVSGTHNTCVGGFWCR